jgi:hypothetical protein
LQVHLAVSIQTEQKLVEITYGLEHVLDIAVSIQSLPNPLYLAWMHAQLTILSARIVNAQHPKRMSLPAPTLVASAAVVDGALKERATHHIANVAKRGDKNVPTRKQLRTCHLYR